MAISPLDNYSKYPRMAHWFNPMLLFKLVGNVILSSVFGQYADRRLMIAALDTVPPEVHVKRAEALQASFKPDADGAVWLDFVADLGDGFDSTYAVASLLAKKELQLGGETLPRGQALVMGGDEVYPAATGPAYRNQLFRPYAWAFPDHDYKDDAGVPLFAIPGNHDWYDGLVHFLAYFCKEKPWHVGNWRTRQRRSYFAIKITEKWWLWATDIQLADDMDQPQVDYFMLIAEKMPRDSRIILCSAEPGWLYTDTNSGSWRIMDYAIRIATEADRGLTVPVLLSGDTHHYSRYAAANGTQFVTSGGGGAFLHPTHQLEPTVTVEWLKNKDELKLGTIPAGASPADSNPACYPPQDVSRSLVWRNLYFAFTNWDFSCLFGVIYWLMAIGLTLRDCSDMYIFVALLFGWVIIGYTTKQEKSYRPTVLISSFIHAAAHFATVVYFARWFAHWNDANVVLADQCCSVWKWLAILLAEMGAVGFLVGSTLFGLNLLITCRWFRMSRNDAFSAFRLGRYNNFLRIRIKGEDMEVFAVGLGDVPKRDDWMENPKYVLGNPEQPLFIARSGLAPHLIERFAVKRS
jgi:Calcineurin-like phosphoesterase